MSTSTPWTLCANSGTASDSTSNTTTIGGHIRASDISYRSSDIDSQLEQNHEFALQKWNIITIFALPKKRTTAIAMLLATKMAGHRATPFSPKKRTQAHAVCCLKNQFCQSDFGEYYMVLAEFWCKGKYFSLLLYYFLLLNTSYLYLFRNHTRVSMIFICRWLQMTSRM